MNAIYFLVLVGQFWKSEAFSVELQNAIKFFFTEERNLPIARHSKIPSMTRTRFFTTLSTKTMLGILMIHPEMALANNLPPSNGADLSRTGTISSLIPILRMQMSLQQVHTFISEKDMLSIKDLYQINEICNEIPKQEKLFKKLFDEYSDPVSYKQRYMDQNAFLVYYTKGFDGIGRESIEKGDIPKQTLQYGARNEAWTAFDDFMAEVQFSLGNHNDDPRESTSTTKVFREDLLNPLNHTLSAFHVYLNLVPSNDLVLAEEQIK